MKEEKELWELIRALDGKAECSCRELIVALRSAADQLEQRIESDGSEEGWQIHGTDADLSAFMDKMSRDIKGKIDTAALDVSSAQHKFECFEEMMG